MPFFDFLSDNPRYAGKKLSINRLNKRHRFLIGQFAEDIKDARVLDLASHDGRWSYALSAAGAREVVGVEVRADQSAQFEAYPDSDLKSKVRFIHGDVYEQLPLLAADEEQFDVVAIYGLYYHVMDHYGLLNLCHQMRPKLIIIDSEFALAEEPVIRLAEEPTSSHLNSVAYTPDQAMAPVGIPSRSAMEVMARSLGYEVTWTDWNAVPPKSRGGLKSYYRQPPRWKRRETCALRPVGREATP